MKKRATYLLLSVALLALWQYFGSTSNSVRLLVSSPELVYEYFIANRESLLQATWVTFAEAVLGLLIATCFSFIVMIICFRFSGFMEFVLPIMIASQVVPIIVLAPFFVILLGIGMASKVAMSAVISFFPIFVNFAQGYRSIDENVNELTYVYDASLQFKIRKVYFPLSLPSIMAGLKISSTLSVIGAIVAEFTGAEIGLGKNLFLSAIRLEPEMMMSSIFLASFLGGTMYISILLLESYFGHWYKQTQI